MEIFKDLPPWAKGILAVTLTVGAGAGIFFVAKAIKKRINPSSEETALRNLAKKNEEELVENEPIIEEMLGLCYIKIYKEGIYKITELGSEVAINSIFQ